MALPPKDPVTGKFVKAEPNPDDAAPNTQPQDQQPEVKEPAEKTPEQVEAEKRGGEKFAAAFLSDGPITRKPVEKPEKKEGEEKDEDTPTKLKAKPAAAKFAVVPPKPKPTPPAEPSLTREQIIAAAAEGAARAVAPKKEDEKAPKEEDLTADLTEDQKQDYVVLQQMEKLNPAKYKGHAQKLVEGLRKAKAYMADWQKKHPGEDFDETAEEHNEFYSENIPDWEDRDYTKALAAMMAEERLKPELDKLSSRLSEFEQEKARNQQLAEDAPKIAAEQTTAARLLWKSFGDDHADAVDEKGVFNTELAKTLQEADPEGFALKVQAARDLDFEVDQAYKLFNGLVKPEKDPNAPLYKVHQNLAAFSLAQEQRIAALPREEQLDAEGRSFISFVKYNALPESERGKYWTMTATYLAALRAADLAQKTQQYLAAEEEKFTARAKARGLIKGDSPAKPRLPAAKPAAEPDEPLPRKGASPSISAPPNAAGRRQGAAANTPNNALAFINRGID